MATKVFFQSAVDLQPLPEIYKLDYLLASEVGLALRVLAGYAVIPENYKKPLETLKKRFGDTNLIQQQLHRGSKKLKIAQQTAEVMQLVYDYERIVKLLDNVGEKQTNTKLRR